jgi:hypothetical protein
MYTLEDIPTESYGGKAFTREDESDDRDCFRSIPVNGPRSLRSGILDGSSQLLALSSGGRFFLRA